MQIKESTDYEKFATIIGNRSINQKKVERICTEIKNGHNLLPYAPIIVQKNNGKYLIIDSQHRYNCSVKLELPVYYVEYGQASLQSIASMNSNTDKWKSTDFLECYIQLGNDDYSTLKNVVKTYKIAISVAIQLLAYGSVGSGGRGGDDFKNGGFVIKHYELTIAVLSKMEMFDMYEFGRHRDLVSALLTIYQKGLIDWNVLERKINNNPMLMSKCLSPKNYILKIEQVYNHNNKERKIIA